MDLGVCEGERERKEGERKKRRGRKGEKEGREREGMEERREGEKYFILYTSFCYEINLIVMISLSAIYLGGGGEREKNPVP